MNEADLLYSSTHEWVQIDGDACTVGITKFAVDQLTDLVYVELPAVGKSLKVGDSFGVVESVKAVSELYAPLAGEVTAINEKVAADPGLLSQDPFGAGWLIKLRLASGSDTGQLMDKASYDEKCSHESH